MENTSQNNTDKKALAIGGWNWLSLLCLALVANFFVIIYDMAASNFEAFGFLVDLVLLALNAFILYLIYKRDHRFKKYVVILFSIGFVVALLASLATNWQDGSFAQPIVAAAIWIPYVLISKRVKSTFVF
jgi:hypothetical protein